LTRQELVAESLRTQQEIASNAILKAQDLNHDRLKKELERETTDETDDQTSE